MYAGMRSADASWFQRRAVKIAFGIPGISWKVYQGRDDGPDGKSLFVDLGARDASTNVA